MKKILIYAIIALLPFGLVLALPSTPTMVSTVPTKKNVVIEEFTGIYCTYCPDGHKIVNNIMALNQGRVFGINIHQGDFAATTNPDYRTQWGDTLADFSGLTGYPAGMVNRHKFSGSYAVMRGSFQTFATQLLNQSAYVNVAAKAEIDASTRTLTVDVELYYTGNSPQSANMLNVALIQDSIMGPQVGCATWYPEMVHDGEYQHNHMLRDFLTGQWGDSIQTTVSGTFVAKRYIYSIPTAYRSIPVNLNKLQVVAYLAEGKAEIISAAEATPIVTGTTAISTINADNTNIYYANKNLVIQTDEQIKNVEVYTVAGQKVFTASTASTNIPLNLKTGVYVVKVQTDSGYFTKKVIAAK